MRHHVETAILVSVAIVGVAAYGVLFVAERLYERVTGKVGDGS